MPVVEVPVTHKVGLHARPAALFVKTAAKYPCNIKVANLSGDGKSVNAKSILSVLTLGVQPGHVVKIEAEGEQAEAALAALVKLISENFGEASE
jgi:phosphotransferase system HPr (HPr) family protein